MILRRFSSIIRLRLLIIDSKKNSRFALQFIYYIYCTNMCTKDAAFGKTISYCYHSILVLRLMNNKDRMIAIALITSSRTHSKYKFARSPLKFRIDQHSQCHDHHEKTKHVSQIYSALIEKIFRDVGTSLRITHRNV